MLCKSEPAPEESNEPPMLWISVRVLYLLYNFGYNYEAACPTERLSKELFLFKQPSTLKKSGSLGILETFTHQTWLKVVKFGRERSRKQIGKL